jgi:hypothetical protein
MANDPHLRRETETMVFKEDKTVDLVGLTLMDDFSSAVTANSADGTTASDEENTELSRLCFSVRSLLLVASS